MQPISEHLPAIPLVSSVALAWKGVKVEQYRLEPMELPPHYHQHHLLMLYQTDGPITVRRRHGARVQEEPFRTGNLGLCPGGEYNTVAWNGSTHLLRLHIDDKHLEEVARRDLDLVQFSLLDTFRFDDPFLTQLGRQLLAASDSRNALSLLYIESLTNALCHHLLEYYATRQRRSSRRPQVMGCFL